MSEVEEPTRRRNAVAEYRKKLFQHKELESRVRSSPSLSPPLPLQTLIPFNLKKLCFFLIRTIATVSVFLLFSFFIFLN